MQPNSCSAQDVNALTLPLPAPRIVSRGRRWDTENALECVVATVWNTHFLPAFKCLLQVDDSAYHRAAIHLHAARMHIAALVPCDQRKTASDVRKAKDLDNIFMARQLEFGPPPPARALTAGVKMAEELTRVPPVGACVTAAITL